MSKTDKGKKYYDYSLAVIILFLAVFGIVMIYSSSSYTAQLTTGDPGYYAKRQAAIAGAGFICMILISLVDYHIWLKFAPYAYIASLVLCFLTLFIGKEINGRKRWIEIGPVQFQPSELTKIAVILLFAVLIVKLGKLMHKWKGLLICAVFVLPAFVLVGAANLSAAIIIAAIPFVMAFVVSDKNWIFLLIAGLLVILILFANQIIEPVAKMLNDVGLLKPYQLSRILVWLEPEAHPLDGGYQVLQGLYAVGSGGLMGKGLGESIQKLGFVPEAQNDMIFSIICEELGLIGAISVILLFAFMIFRFFIIANSAPDSKGTLLVTGVMTHIALQVILNIAVVCNVIPNTGITLPFISYGGTSVFLLMIEMGLVLSVSHQIRLDKYTV